MSNETIGQQYKRLTRNKKKINNKRFIKYIMKFKGNLVLIIFSTILLIAETAAIPKIIQIIIDDYLPKIPGNWISNDAMKMIIILIIIMFGLIVIRATAVFISTYILRKFQQNIEMKLKEEMFMKIQKLNVSFFDQVNEGYFMSRMTRDAVMAGEYARYVPENVLKIFFSLTISLTFLFTFSWIIGIAVIAILLVLFIYTFAHEKRFIKSWTSVKKEGDNFSQFLVNAFSGIKETKAYVKDKSEQSKYLKAADSYKKIWKKQFLLYGEWMSFSTLFLFTLPIIAISVGSSEVLKGTMTIGALTASLMYAWQVINPVNEFFGVFDLFMRGNVSIERIFSLLDEKEERYHGKELDLQKGLIEFKNVKLKYSEDIHALNGVSFRINPGEKVAFVGTTGSGKSTILKALIKFYEVDKGVIKIDNQDIKNINVRSLRKKITLMPQEPYLFFDSVKNNIVFGGNSNTTDEHYQKAIKQTQAWKFINDLPYKDETNIGPRGVSLSGGQKQRVALARAVLKNSKIILLDEATSALDNQTEKSVKNQLEKISKDKTVIYVAHRLTTIKHVDRIFVLEKGMIKESGSHHELIQKKGIYYKLINSSSI